MNDYLFRKEAIKSQGERLLRDFILSQPISYYIYSVFLISSAFIGLLFLIFNDYSRKQTVTGFLAPDNGIVSVYPSEIGILNQLMIKEGAMRRLRPVMMTATICAFGLVPLLLATGPGSEIQKPLAIVVIGGLISSTLLTLFLLPIVYRKFHTNLKVRAA